MRKELRSGLLLSGITLALQCLSTVPDGISGFLLGLSICLEIIGILPEEVYKKLKVKKKALFRLP